MASLKPITESIKTHKRSNCDKKNHRNELVYGSSGSSARILYFISLALDDTNDVQNDADGNHGKQHYVHAFIHLVPVNIAMYCLVISN